MQRFIVTREGWHVDAGAIRTLEKPQDGWVRASLENGSSAEIPAADAEALLAEQRESLVAAQFGWEVVFAFSDGTYAKAPIVAWRVTGSRALPVTTAPAPERATSPVVYNSQSGHAFAEGSRGAQGLDEAIAAAIMIARERSQKAAE